MECNIVLKIHIQDKYAYLTTKFILLFILMVFKTILKNQCVKIGLNYSGMNSKIETNANFNII
jgi:hypothetical protein